MELARRMGFAGLAVLAIALAHTGVQSGDAGRGAKLYATLPCASCHDISHPWPGGDKHRHHVTARPTGLERRRAYGDRRRPFGVQGSIAPRFPSGATAVSPLNRLVESGPSCAIRNARAVGDRPPHNI
jgi:hypothetical protein